MDFLEENETVIMWVAIVTVIVVVRKISNVFDNNIFTLCNFMDFFFKEKPSKLVRTKLIVL